KVLKSRWLELLDRIAAEPTQRLCDLTSSLSPGRAEARPSGGTCFRMSGKREQNQQQPLKEWNATHTNYPREATIQEVFQQQVQRTPSAVALVFQNTQLSYDALNRGANRLARRLQELNINRDVPVGVWMERSPEMVIAILAILKAGGAYVPLDPSYPAERRALMIDDTQMPVILAQEHLESRGTPEGCTAQLLWVDAANLPDERDTNLADDVDAGDLAYVMYTSGSTGTP